jgi:hypothetical protein
MNTAGWVFMIFSWAALLAMSIFCFIKVFSKRELK